MFANTVVRTCRWGLLPLLLLLLGLRPAAGQVRVSGSVSDQETKKPVSGATILNVSSRLATTADDDGDFNVVVRATDTIEFRAVGYEAQRLPLRNTGLSQLVLQVKLKRSTVQLSEVQVLEGRPDDATINRALRNMKRPTAPANAVKLPPKPKPLFAVDSTAPKAPKASLMNPVSLIYDQFSREGMQRRKMEEIEEEKRLEAERQKRRDYNKNFVENRGYEIEGDPKPTPQAVAPGKNPAKAAPPRMPVQPPAGALAPRTEE